MCFSPRVCRRGDGVGSSKTRRSESMGATPPRVLGSKPPSPSRLVCLSTARSKGSRLREATSQQRAFGVPAALAQRFVLLSARPPPRTLQRNPSLAAYATHSTCPQNTACSSHNHDGGQVVRFAASFHQPKTRAPETRRAHARAPQPRRARSPPATASPHKRHRRDSNHTGSPSSRRRAPRHRASASSPSRTPEVRRTSTPASTSSMDARTTS